MSTQTLLGALRAIVGTGHVLTAPADVAGYAEDWRKRYRGAPLAVVLPGSTDEVAAVVRRCHAARAAIVPQGGNTGLAGGATPDGSGTQIVLSLRRMRRIRSLDAADRVLVAEAGVVLAEAQRAAREAGLLFPLSLAAEGSATIGGVLATNAGGTAVLRYGNARALCLGLEAVTAQGAVWHGLSALRKDNTGYDLRDLLIGSEGTLGILTAASLALFPQPAARRTAWVAVPDLAQAVALLGRARDALDAGLTGFELMGAPCIELVARHFPALRAPLPAGAAPWFVLLELSDSESEAHAQERLEAVLGAALEAGVAGDCAVAASLAHSETMWAIREHIPLAQAAEGLNIKHDLAVPVSRMAGFVADTAARLQRLLPEARLIVFGHLGDGNLHYNVQAPSGADSEAFRTRWEGPCNALLHEAAVAAGGSFSAEHGIGMLKTGELARFKDPAALALMRGVKQALDPQGLLNPGKVLAAV